MNNSLFQEFSEVSAKEWKQKIQADLKGADYNSTLVWQSLEGIHVKPFYHEDDFPNGFQSLPESPKHWSVVQTVYIDDESIANNLALDSIKRGAEAIRFQASKAFKINDVFNNFPFEQVSIYFELTFLDVVFKKELISFLVNQKARVYYNIDLVHQLANDGNWFHNLEKDHQILDALISGFPKESILGVNTIGYQNAGANIVQQLAYALAHANEYLNHLNEKDIQLHSPLNFQVSIGANYFFEIAKIRALRWLYASLAQEYNAPQNCHIFAQPSKRNKTIYDYNVNMLRTTTECMSAVLGGVDAITNLPYDALYQKSNEFGERISRNQLLILKSESYFDQVINPAEGSYYIESLTQELANKALELFKEIEASGGFLSQLKAGTIQKKIKESSEKEQSWFDEGKLVLVGTNQHPNENDRMKDQLELYPFVKKKPRKTLIEPIIERRLSESLELKRLENE